MKAKLITACGCEQWIDLLDCCEGDYIKIALTIQVAVDPTNYINKIDGPYRMFKMYSIGSFYEDGLHVRYHIYREVLE